MTINEERAKKAIKNLDEGEKLRLVTNPYNPGVTRIDVIEERGAEFQCFIEQYLFGYQKALKILRDSGKVATEENGRFW